MPRVLLAAALLSSTLWMSSTQANAVPELDTRCPMLGGFLDELAGPKWREHPTHAFWSKQSAIIVTTSGRNGTWTMIVLDKLGAECIARPVSSGRGYWQAPAGEGS